MITLSPFFKPNAKTDKCNPEVALFTAIAYFESVYNANFSSNSLTLGPCVRKSEVKVLTTVSISS